MPSCQGMGNKAECVMKNDVLGSCPLQCPMQMIVVSNETPKKKPYN